MKESLNTHNHQQINNAQMDYLDLTQTRFYPCLRRPSQSGAVNSILFLDSGECSSHNEPQDFLHFRKNFNKVESNINQNTRFRSKISKRNLSKMKKTMVVKKYNPGNSGKPRLEPIKKTMSKTCGNFFHKNRSPDSKQQIKKPHLYPRFKTMELYSLYQSIISYSGCDLSRFLQGFEASLNFQKIMIKPEVVRRCLFDQKDFSFQSFLRTFKKLQDLMFIQSITDYLQIIFQTSNKHLINKERINEVLCKRSCPKEAAQITTLIFKKIGKRSDELISLQEILDLCEQDYEFSSTLSKMYHEELKEVN